MGGFTSTGKCSEYSIQDATNQRRILLVENDPNDIKLTLLALQRCDLASRMDIVNDGCEALDYLFCRDKYENREKINPLFILLDLKMPKICGLEVLKRVRLEPSLRIIPIIVFTSSRQNKDLLECYEAGSNSYVVKPVDFHSFEKVLIDTGLYWSRVNEPFLPVTPIQSSS